MSIVAQGDPWGPLWQELFWTAVLIMSVAVWFSIRRIPGWLRAFRSASWPITEGRIEDGKVTAFAEQSLGELSYWYSVEGERYSGYFHQQFADEQEAWEYIHPLKGQVVFVRYEPGAPEISAIRIADQNPLFTARKSLPTRLLSRSIFHLVGVSNWDFLDGFGAKNWPMSKGKVEYGTVTRKGRAICSIWPTTFVK